MAFRGPFTLVLSGGGLKGLAHIGVLRALEERGLQPGLVVGSSMGSLIAAAWASGMSIPEMTERGLAVRRKDIFQVAHVDMALKRMRAPAVYRREPLDALIDSLAAAGIAYVPLFPLGGFAPLQSSTLSDVARQLDATPMQVALAWLLRRSPNILLIPGTSSVEHLRENLAAADLELSDDAMKKLDRI